MEPISATIIDMNATTDFLKSEILKKDSYISQLQSAHANAVTRSTDESAERNRMRNEMQDWTLNALTERLISESDAEEIASICGFELTQEFELEVSVQYSVTVNARNEEEAMNLMYDIDFDSVSYPDGITYLSSTVDRVDI
jgi:outer membrane lipopolysaccharide assembly protein LptE/RlpB